MYIVLVKKVKINAKNKKGSIKSLRGFGWDYFNFLNQPLLY